MSYFSQFFPKNRGIFNISCKPASSLDPTSTNGLAFVPSHRIEHQTFDNGTYLSNSHYLVGAEYFVVGMEVLVYGEKSETKNLN